MNNRELKLYAASKGVRLWQVAEKFGITDAAFSRSTIVEILKGLQSELPALALRRERNG